MERPARCPHLAWVATMMGAEPHTEGAGRAQSSSLLFLGMDVHRDWISAGVLSPGEDAVVVDKMFHDEVSVRRLIARIRPDGGRIHACYEAGPTGYELARLLAAMGVRCDVIAPSLIPKAPGDKVKTDKRDAVRLTRLLRAGELVVGSGAGSPRGGRAGSVSSEGGHGDRSGRARQRLGKFLLRHGRVFARRHDGLDGQASPVGRQPAFRRSSALTMTFSHYRPTLIARESALSAMEADLASYYTKEPFAGQVSRLAAYRGITPLGGLTLATEVCDWQRFPTAASFMGFCGLVPSEYSSGGRTSRGRITKAGNRHLRTQLIESAWAYQHQPNVGATIRKRQEGLPPQTVARAWTAQQRLCRSSGDSTLVRTPPMWWPPRSPANSPGSSGQR